MRLGLEGGGARHVKVRGRQVQVDGHHREASAEQTGHVQPTKRAPCALLTGQRRHQLTHSLGAPRLHWEQESAMSFPQQVGEDCRSADTGGGGVVERGVSMRYILGGEQIGLANGVDVAGVAELYCGARSFVKHLCDHL